MIGNAFTAYAVTGTTGVGTGATFLVGLGIGTRFSWHDSLLGWKWKPTVYTVCTLERVSGSGRERNIRTIRRIGKCNQKRLDASVRQVDNMKSYFTESGTTPGALRYPKGGE